MKKVYGARNPDEALHRDRDVVAAWKLWLGLGSDACCSITNGLVPKLAAPQGTGVEGSLSTGI